MTEQQIQAEREAFETWARGSYFLTRVGGEVYENVRTAGAWDGWLDGRAELRAALAHQQAAQAVGLTDAEMDRIYNDWLDKGDNVSYDDLMRAVERVLLSRAAPAGDVVAWVHEDDPARVISAAQKAHALKDGGASASSVRPYSLAAVLSRAAPSGEPVANNEAYDFAYDKIDRFLRSNLNDDDYAEFSQALDSLAAPQPRAQQAGWVRHDGAMAEFTDDPATVALNPDVWRSVAYVAPLTSAQKAEYPCMSCADCVEGSAHMCPHQGPTQPFVTGEQPAEEARGVDDNWIIDALRKDLLRVAVGGPRIGKRKAQQMLALLAAPAAGAGQVPVPAFWLSAQDAEFLRTVDQVSARVTALREGGGKRVACYFDAPQAATVAQEVPYMPANTAEAQGYVRGIEDATGAQDMVPAKYKELWRQCRNGMSQHHAAAVAAGFDGIGDAIAAATDAATGAQGLTDAHIMAEWDRQWDTATGPISIRRVVCATVRAILAQAAPSAVGTEWQDISTAPWSDDLIWLMKGDSIDGPKRIEHDDYDRYTHWAPCEPPDLAASKEA